MHKISSVFFREVAKRQRIFGWGGVLILAMAALSYAIPSMSALNPEPWPVIELPEGSDGFSVGEQILSNGMPMRVRGFFSEEGVPKMVGWFKNKLGQPLMVDRLSDKVILGRAQGDYYITIQLEPTKTGTRGLVSVSDVRASLERRDQTRNAVDAWKRDLPSGTKILNMMSSVDGGKVSLYFLASNQQSDALNTERSTSALLRRGFVVERKGELNPENLVDGQTTPISGKTVWFKSDGREAILMAFHDRRGQASIVINTIETLKVAQ